MIIQNRTISVALKCTQAQTSKKALKILVLQLALKVLYLPPVTGTSDVLLKFYVRLIFGLQLVLVMIRVGAKFRF